MARIRINVKFTVLSIVFGTFVATARASEDPANRLKELIFVINGHQEPVSLSQSRPKGAHVTIMRLPDLQFNVKNSHPNSLIAGQPAVVRGVKHRYESEKTEPQQAASSKKMTLKFKGATVLGTAKRPRVRFADLKPTVEILEESPSLDFTAKSLKDGGF